MSKFSSFLVFSFGIFVFVVIAVVTLQPKTVPVPHSTGEPNAKLPQSDMAPLELGTREQFQRQLDKLYANGGVKEVQKFVETEMKPGRLVHLGRPGGGDTSRTFRLIDREMRRCESGGATQLDKPPILPRASTMLRMGDGGAIETWQRLEARTPYSITVWWSAEGK